MPKTIYFGRFISAPTPDSLLILTGAVLVSNNDGHGTIEKADWTVNGAADALSKFNEEVPVVTANENGFFFPGFIDSHIHASQYPNAGIFGKSTLLDWLTTYTFPLESSLGSEKSPMYTTSTNSNPPDPLLRATAVYNRVIASTLSHGTTTAAYYATISVPATNILAEIAFKRGQRAYIGRVCMDNPDMCPNYYRDESTEDTIANTQASIDYCRSLDPTGDLLAPIITPRFAPSCQPSTLSALGKLAKEQELRVQTHISENVSEVKLVSELFPQQSNYADVYDMHGLLGPRTVLAHAVHLSEEEIQLIAQRKSKVSHCPASNSALGSGFCSVRALLDGGVEVGLGTDVSGGYSCSVLEAVRQACLVSRHVGFVNGGNSRFNIGVAEGLYLGTVGGGKVVGLEGRVGGFEVGMSWDVQEIWMGDVTADGEVEDGCVDIFGWEGWEERVAKWVWNGDDRNVKRVWVGGRLVHERR
jgi:guanine deaminase